MSAISSSMPSYDKSSQVIDRMAMMDIKPGKKMSLEQIQQASQDFEAVFLSQMLEHLFSGVQLDANAQDSESNDVYRSMLLDEYGKTIAKAGGIGIADYVTKEMLRYQEAQPTQTGGIS